MTKYKDQKAEKLIRNFPDEVNKIHFANEEKQLKELLDANAGKSMTPELVDSLSKALTKDLDYMISHAISKDLRIMLPTDSRYTFDTQSIDNVINAIKKAYAPLNLPESELLKVIPDKEVLAEALNNKGLLNGSYKDFSEHSKVIQSLLEERIEVIKAESPDGKLAKRLEFHLNKLIHQDKFGVDSDLFRSFKQKSAITLTPELSQKLTALSKTINKLKAKHKVLQEYAFLKVGQAPETALADSWNEVSKEIFKAMKFTPKEIKDGRIDREIAAKILREKIEAIASDKTAYDEFVEVVKRGIASLNDSISKINMTKDPQTKTYTSLTEDAFNEAAEVFRSMGMKYSEISLVGYNKGGATSAKALMEEFVNNRTLGVKSSFYRLLNMLDLYHRLATVQNVDGALNFYMPREIKEECAELAKEISLGAHTSDFAVKFWQRRNPKPNTTDYSQIEVEAGKIINKYFGKVPPHKLAELSNDREYFKAVMQLLFTEKVHPDTAQRLYDSGFLSDFEAYRKQAHKILGGDQYFAKPHHLVDYAATESTSLFRFLLMGSSPDEMVFKYFNQTFNSKKWFSMFGKLGGIIAGATILAQFFFGKMKAPEKKQEVK
jgi:hypothetical protein